MIKIALVGDIGSGKSFFSRLFKYPVFNADLEVNKIYSKDKNFNKLIKRKFPHETFSFPLKKEELIECILTNQGNLKRISKIVHPIVRKKLNIFLKNAKEKGHATINGKLMLLLQAQKAFEIWTGINPKIDKKFLNYLND